jgi:[acyl-carrier-protein] S-malonyltransferase
MGADLYGSSTDARGLFDRADGILGFSLSGICFEGPDEDLRQTINTQPALYVTSCAALAALASKVELKPFAVAGHSVGEYAALYAAGAMSFEKGLELVRKRAELMQQAARSRPGAMAAILGLDATETQAACDAARAETGGVINVANYNCPGQIVISGLSETVERASDLCKERGAKRALILPVSGGFHSPLMVTAGDALYPSLREALFQNPRVPVVTNVNAEYTKNAVDFAPLLTMQVSGSVRWEESMQRLLADGVTTFFEIGCGDVLSGLMKRIDRSARTLSVQDLASLEAASALIEEMNAVPAPAASVVVSDGGGGKDRIYHVTKRDLWEAAAPTGEYRAPDFASEGFIHASTVGQVADVANNYYRARTGLVLLEIDTTKVKPEVRYEVAANGQQYPHIYGPLNTDAVARIFDLPGGPDGRFKLPEEVS